MSLETIASVSENALSGLRPAAPLQLSGPIRWPPLRPGRLNTTTRDTIGMGLIGKFFGVRKRRSDLSPEVVHIFEKIENFLISDDAQNAALPESLRKLIEAGAAVDELHGAKGEFGRCVTNSIPINGAVGEIVYLSRLVTPSGAGLFGHRLGRIDRVDVYETVSTDGRIWDIIFLDYYHPRKSHKAPTGYGLSKAEGRPIFITCTNFRVDSFPFPIEAAIRECMRRVIGFPVRPPNVANLLTSGHFVCPSEHTARLAQLHGLGVEPAANFKDVGG